MKFAVAYAFAAVVASTSCSAIAAPKPVESWGRSGVDFDTYRTDAIECAASAYYADVSETDQAKAFVTASKQLETTDNGYTGDIYQIANNAGVQEHIKQSIQPDRKLMELRDGLQSIVDSCLLDRGYSKFRLTEDQRAALGKLRKGSDERHHYLHSLASSAQVLKTQEISG